MPLLIVKKIDLKHPDSKLKIPVPAYNWPHDMNKLLEWLAVGNKPNSSCLTIMSCTVKQNCVLIFSHKCSVEILLQLQIYGAAMLYGSTKALFELLELLFSRIIQESWYVIILIFKAAISKGVN